VPPGAQVAGAGRTCCVQEPAAAGLGAASPRLQPPDERGRPEVWDAPPGAQVAGAPMWFMVDLAPLTCYTRPIVPMIAMIDLLRQQPATLVLRGSLR
jgi:hypothetical protein